VAAAVRALGHTVLEADIGPDDLSALDEPVDIVFPVLHGRFGEDGQLQAILEQRGLCFVGSGSAASRLSIDKDATKRVWRDAGLPTAPWALVNGAPFDGPALAALRPPVVVKPVAEGSSIGVSVCESLVTLEQRLPALVAQFGRVMVERRLNGPELTVGVLGDSPLPVIQVKAATEFYDYQAKYQRSDTAYLLSPNIDRMTYHTVQQLAVRAFLALGCRDYSRVDFIVDQRDGPQLLEINTIPGFTDHSLLPKAAGHAGIDFNRLVKMLLQMAWSRHTRR